MSEALWLIHGVIRSATSAPAGAPPHRRAAFGALTALISPAGLTGSAEADAAEALRHDAILSAYAAEGDVVPVRFGAAADDPAAAAGLLAPREAEFTATLARVAGSVEFGARLIREGTAPVEAAPVADGAGYLRAKSAARRAKEVAAQQRAALSARLVAAVSAHAVMVEAAPRAASEARLVDLALLVRRDAAAGLRRAAAALEPEAAALGLVLRLGGPWAPYSFVAAPAEAPT